MPAIDLDPQQRDAAIRKLQDYFETELDRELGSFEAGFLLDFLADNIGAAFYNQGLYDAVAALSKQFDTMSEGVLALEKPTNL